MRFVVDSMLGRFAKWLRVLGYDTHYSPYYKQTGLDQPMEEDTYLISRNHKAIKGYKNGILLKSNHVNEQLKELRRTLELHPERSKWFSRCIVCNTVLKKTTTKEARENVPEYIFYQNMTGIRYCPTCRRYYWPGSHRSRMEKQLKEWGF